jgi:hypothetical protein
MSLLLNNFIKILLSEQPDIKIMNENSRAGIYYLTDLPSNTESKLLEIIFNMLWNCVNYTKDWEQYIFDPVTKKKVFGDKVNEVIKKISLDLFVILIHEDFDISKHILKKNSYMKSEQDLIGLFFHMNCKGREINF